MAGQGHRVELKDVRGVVGDAVHAPVVPDDGPVPLLLPWKGAADLTDLLPGEGCKGSRQGSSTWSPAKSRSMIDRP